MSSILRLHDLECMVRLGCTAEERTHPQKVLWNIEFIFAEIPLACRSDQLSDAICYDRVARSLAAVGESKEFQLIEHLVFEAVQSLKDWLPSGPRMRLQVKKVAPPIPIPNRGSSFEMEEQL